MAELTIVPRPKDPSLAGKTERIDTRVAPATREALQRAADATGWSLSREIEERLVKTLANDGASGVGARRDTDALLWGLRLVIERVEQLTGQEWQEDGFTRDAVADGVAQFVRELGPDSSPPPSTFPTLMDWTDNVLLKQEAADELIKQGVGKRCARETITAMEQPLPENPALRALMEHGWAEERTIATRLKGLMRVRFAGKTEGSDDE